MLELRPTCENCGRALPPESLDARICSFECTFCASCVETVLSNVCPNCGGGFERRPIRPATAWTCGATRAVFAPLPTEHYQPVDPATHAALVAKIGGRGSVDR